MVEWMSAVEGAMQKVMRQIAGMEDPTPQRASHTPTHAPPSNNTDSILRQLQQNFSDAQRTRGSEP